MDPAPCTAVASKRPRAVSEDAPPASPASSVSCWQQSPTKDLKRRKTKRQGRKVILKQEVQRLQDIVDDMQSEVEIASDHIRDLKDMLEQLRVPKPTDMPPEDDHRPDVLSRDDQKTLEALLFDP